MRQPKDTTRIIDNTRNTADELIKKDGSYDWLRSPYPSVMLDSANKRITSSKNYGLPLAPPLGLTPLSQSLKAPPAYIDELERDTDPTVVLALYTAEAERINRWINVGFKGLIIAVDEKLNQTDEYEKAVKTWDAECKKIIAAQDEKVIEAVKPKKRFGIF